MVGLFSFISILIACFGLFGLVSFIANRKVKEIGIRKVNGAKVSEILTMLNKDFVKWVVIAFVIAAPIAYYAMNKWLENFAYKTNLSWWIFALAGLLALGIALLTVSWQSWRAATRNPVEALRYE
jgi:putative ABC transport system permease protein